MPLLLIFALLLFSGVLISCRARESVLSTSALFLVTALLLGRFGVVQPPGRSLLYRLAEIALYSVLFSDGMKTGGLSMLRSRWWPVARTLFVGMPLTIALVAVLAHLLLGFGWHSSAALGAALSPTDPVFVAAIFAVEAVPVRVKETLTVESGFNDGLALPAVFLLVPRMMGNSGAGGVVVSLLEGLALGVIIPWVAIKIEELPLFGAAGVYERLHPFAIALILYGSCSVLNANLFVAAFTAGLTIATVRQQMQEAFEDFASPVTELLKLGTILIFALRVGPLVFSLQSWQVYLLVVLSAFAVRMAAVPVALLWSRVTMRERLLIGWFGPKGFASVVYGLMLLEVGSPELNRTATVIALTVVLSIFGYSSTDVLLGRWLKRSPVAPSDAVTPEQRAGGERS